MTFRSCAWIGLLTGWLFAAAGGRDLSAWEGATDWPQFRGPEGLGVSSSKGLPVSWSQTENMLWKTALPGPGTSSPIVVGDRIFLTCYTGYNVPGGGRGAMDQLKLYLVCLDRETGSIRWNAEIAPVLPEQTSIREEHGYSSSTPVATGDGWVYAFFGKSGVYAFDFEGKQRWKADVGSGLHGWGSAASPILFDDLLIVNASVESESLVALDRKTGREVWRVRDIRDAWNTPLLVALPDGRRELVVAMPRKVVGFDPSSAEALWSCANDITWYIAPSAVAHKDVVWSIGGRSGVAAVALRAGGRGDVTKSHRLWTGHKGSNVCSPIFHAGHLYWMHDNLGIAYCADADTGKIRYEERIAQADQIYASPVLADDKVYYVSRRGRTFVLAAKPEYELLAANDLSDGSAFNASPAVTGKRLLLRSDRYLYCVGEK